MWLGVGQEVPEAGKVSLERLKGGSRRRMLGPSGQLLAGLLAAADAPRARALNPGREAASSKQPRAAAD